MANASGLNESATVRRVAIVGAGTMGHGIAVAFAVGDRAVTLVDVNERALQAARVNIRDAVSTLVDHETYALSDAEPVLNAIEYELSIPDAVADADMVVEAVSEEIETKMSVFREIERHAPADAVFASNTSSLSITKIGSSIEEPCRLLGTHWFHPPHIVPVVEVVKGEETADEPVRVVCELLDRIGKTPVIVEKDITGFIGNRIQTAMAHEAWSLLNEGVASADDIDKVIKGTFGFRLPVLGVFEKGDCSGLDIHAKVLAQLLTEIDRGTTPPDSLMHLVEEGHHGMKTGTGVYDWTAVDVDAASEERDKQLLSLLDVYQQRERSAPRRED